MSVSSPTITILQLYPRDMNIYGDQGNVQVLMQRLRWHGYTPKLIDYNPGDTFPSSVDLVIGGGGQDSGQLVIRQDLQAIAAPLKAFAENGVPMLMVCGLYQLFGHFFKTKDGQRIEGIGLLDIETHGGNERLTGNIVTKNALFGEIIGYENHSGQTYLGKDAQPLGTVIRGAGNNGHDDTEGAVYKNIIGTYLHGPLLPKNPEMADWLIEKAVSHKYGEFTPSVIDDRFAAGARKVARKRPR